MDRVKLIDKGKEFMTRFAAPSVLTGYFVAAIPDADMEYIKEAFTEPGDILVHNMDELYSDNVYKGYRRIRKIREQGNEIIVILDKEANDGRNQGE